MAVNKGNGLQSFHPQSLQNVVNTQSCMKKVHHIVWNWYKCKKIPCDKLWSNRPVFASCPLFLPSFPVTLPIHLSTLLQYFPVCGEIISVLNFGAWAPRSGSGSPGGATLGWISVHMELSVDLPNAMQTHAASRVMQLAAGFGNVYLCYHNSLCCSVYPFHPLFFFLL